MDKDAKKRARQTVRAKERAAGRAAMPLAAAQLRELFAWLGPRLGGHTCDRSLRLTRAWLAQHGHDADAVVPWLGDCGGFCDCEVLANVRQHVDEIMHDVE